MSNPSGFSDSQESLKSVLLDDATFHDLQEDVRAIDGIGHLLDGNVMETEQKCILMDGDIMETERKAVMMYAPPQQQHIPVPNEFAGDFNFRLILTQNQSSSKHCVYSELLKKIYINMEQTLPLRFEWQPTVGDLWVRTTMVFALDQYRMDPVVRCHNHMATFAAADNMISPDVLKHVVRCVHPESRYAEMGGGHLSVFVPLGTPQAGTNYVPLNFRFYCKNSCTSGMNRRPTELVFTLETQHGEVLGRRRLPVRVCSCPKRDKEKEELEQQSGKINVGGGKKRKLSAPPAGKKLLVPGVTDAREYVAQFKIPGKENYQAVLKYAYDLMAGQAARTGQHEFVRPYMDNLAQMINHSQ